MLDNENLDEIANQQQLQQLSSENVTGSGAGGGGANSGGNSKCMKHFKKSMIVEYEKIEHISSNIEDSQCSSSSTASSSSSTSSLSSDSNSSTATATSFANSAISNLKKNNNVNNNDSDDETRDDKKLNIKKSKSSKIAPNLQMNKNNLSDLYEDEAEPTAEQINRSQSTKRKNTNSISKNVSSNQKKAKHNNDNEPADNKKSDKNKKIYCICKSADTQRFMIACDNCDEWYHGDCVGVSQSLSNKIKIFYCHICRSKVSNSSLKIKYNNKFQEISKNMREKDMQNSSDITIVRFYKETQTRLKKEAELLKKQETKSSEAKISKGSASNDASSTPTTSANTHNASQNQLTIETSNKTDSAEAKTAAQQNDELLKLSSSRCYGKTNIPGEDIEQFLSAIAILKNDQFSSQVSQTSNTEDSASTQHSNIPHVYSTSPASIVKNDHDYTIFTHADDTSTHSKYSNKRHSNNNNMSSGLSSESSEPEDENDTDYSSSNQVYKKSKNALDTDEDENVSSNGTNNHEEDNENDDEEILKLSKRKQRLKSDESTSGKPSKKNEIKKKSIADKKLNKKNLVINKKPKKGGIAQPSQSNGDPVTGEQQQILKPKLRRLRNSSSVNINETDENSNNNHAINSKSKSSGKDTPVQCLGIECTNPALANSKYCSFECGMRLAKKRLLYYLRSRIEQYEQSPCYANNLNKSELDKINNEMEEIKSKLNELEQRHINLDTIIERAKYQKINPNVEKDRDKYLESNEQAEVYCVTCGISCSEKLALKHMEKCFNKIESQAFFGSFYKTHIDGKSMFCDYYNPQTKMYCKRLKVMCPEHEKEKKINDDEVCGYPLTKSNNLLEDSENEMCLAPKRSCSMHFKWEKLRRAQIDMEKLRAWLKLEELLEQKRMHETSLNQRAGLLSILLHKTDLNDKQPESHPASTSTNPESTYNKNTALTDTPSKNTLIANT